MRKQNGAESIAAPAPAFKIIRAITAWLRITIFDYGINVPHWRYDVKYNLPYRFYTPPFKAEPPILSFVIASAARQSIT